MQVTIRPADPPRDNDALFALLAANRERLGRWLPGVDKAKSSVDTEFFLQQMLVARHTGRGYHWLIEVDGELAGTCSLLPLDRANAAANLGFWLAQAFEGKGVMQQALRAALDFAFSEGGLHRVELQAAISNQRSLALAERLGFVAEGIARDAQKLAQGYVDVARFALLATDWKAKA